MVAVVRAAPSADKRLALVLRNSGSILKTTMEKDVEESSLVRPKKTLLKRDSIYCLPDVRVGSEAARWSTWQK
jgi:hypothetical protein